MDSDKVKRGLKKLKFDEDDKDHKFYILNIGDFKIQTKVSHGSKFEIGKGVLSNIAKQIHISTPFLNDVISCSKNFEDYFLELNNKGILN